ncbi:MAG: single-stranded DNA-binding protein [Bacteroidota bacterium]
MIKLQVIGHLGKDCNVNSVNGKSVINFTVAHSERYKDSQGVQNEKTTWVDCAYWTDKTAISPYLKKGQSVYVEGTPEARHFTRNDGTSGATLSLRVLNIQLVGAARQEGGGNNAPQQNNYQQQAGQPQQNNYSSVPAANEVTEPIDDLPF